MRFIKAIYKSWLVTAALFPVLLSSFANGSLAAPMSTSSPATIQQQVPRPGTLLIITILIGLVERQVAIYVPNGYQPGAPSGTSSSMYQRAKAIAHHNESSFRE